MSKVVKEGTKNSKYAELDYEVLKYDKELNLYIETKNMVVEGMESKFAYGHIN